MTHKGFDGFVLVFFAGLFAMTAGADRSRAGEPAGQPVPFSAVPGFAADDHAAAMVTFQASCAAIVADTPAIRSAQPVPAALRKVCAAALALGPSVAAPVARRFFETNFTPRRLDDAFLTGYYEPIVEGSLAPSAAFSAPILGRPADLVSGIPGRPLPGLDPALSAARRLPDGHLAPYPDRAAIESGALGRGAAPLLYVRDRVEAFFIHVQGSARIRLADGSVRRLVYAGRNGQPYTSIGRLLVEQLGIPPAAMGMAQLKAWIRANGQAPGEAGTLLMQRNLSFIFFAIDATLKPEAGPVGGAGISLTPLRSLAVDRLIWPYGLPVFVDASLPWQTAADTPFRRLLVAQDTGSAIVGPARGDIFFGSGPDAARLAGPIRHSGMVFVLWPNDEPEPGEQR